jgi:hypothetical protein
MTTENPAPKAVTKKRFYEIADLLANSVQPFDDLTAEELAAIAKDLDPASGHTMAIISAGSGRLLDGNQRLRVLQQMGQTKLDGKNVVIDQQATGDNDLQRAVILNFRRRQLSGHAKAMYAYRLMKEEGISQSRIAEDYYGMSRSALSQLLGKYPDPEAESDPMPTTLVGKDGARRMAGPKASSEPSWKEVTDATERDRARRRDAEVRESRTRIGATDEARLDRAALNAPEGKLNLPALRKAREARDLTWFLTQIRPDKFVSQLPIDACREFTADSFPIGWWEGVVALAVDRLKEEGSDLPPLPAGKRFADAMEKPTTATTAAVHIADKVDRLSYWLSPKMLNVKELGKDREAAATVEARLTKLRDEIQALLLPLRAAKSGAKAYDFTDAGLAEMAADNEKEST